jgi:recombination protein RecA
MELGQKENLKVEYIKTGIECIDKIIGDGIPTGRIIEIFGEESCGKTTLCLKIISEVQKTSKACFIDMEHSLDLDWCKKLGVNTDELILTQPDNGEQALEIAERLIKSEKIGVVVIDSVAALVTKSELEGEYGDANMGSMARLMSQAMRKLKASLAKSKTILIFTNQQRDKIGVMFGNPKTTCGGNALKYYASVRIMLTRKDLIKEKKEVLGTNIKAKVIKNKVNIPFAEAIFQINFDGTITEVK